MQKNSITYRKANKSDDFSSIAKFVYQTDPYIYPSISKSYDSDFFLRLIKKCLKEDNNIFALENFYVAEDGGKIIAILCAIKCGEEKTFLENLDLSEGDSQRLKIANEGYFLPLIEESIKFDGYNVTNLCVDAEYRGRGIGEGLLRFYMSQVEGSTVHLDVIADNGSAVRLYTRCGFKIESQFKGFSGGGDTILCYHMVAKR